MLVPRYNKWASKRAERERRVIVQYKEFDVIQSNGPYTYILLCPDGFTSFKNKEEILHTLDNFNCHPICYKTVHTNTKTWPDKETREVLIAAIKLFGG